MDICPYCADSFPVFTLCKLFPTFPFSGSACAVVGQHARRGVVDVAAGPGFVRHPEIDNHLRLTGIVALENLAVQQRLLRERLRMRVFFPERFKLLVGVLLLRKFLQIVHHRVTDRVGERRLFAVQNVVRQIVAFKRMTKQVLALAVFVQLQLRVHAHDVLDEIEVAERHARFERVDADAAVGAQHIIHVQLPDAFFRLLLELLGAEREVGVLVAEQLVGNLAGQNHAQVGVLVNPLAKKIHAHARADGRNIIRAQHADDLFQRIEHLLLCHVDLGVVAADVVCHLLGVLEIDCIFAHADGKSADRRFRLARGNRAHQRRIQTAREQEANLCVGDQTLLYAANELVVNFGTDRLQIVVADRCGLCNIVVAGELAVLIVMSGRKRHDLIAQPDKVLRLACKDDHAFFVVAVVQRANADGVARGDIFLRAPIKQDQRKFRVEHFEHIHAVLKIQRQQNLAVRAADKFILLFQLLLELLEAVNFAVADDVAAVALKRLHAAGRQAHDGKPVKTEQALAGVYNPAVVRSSGHSLKKALLKIRKGGTDIAKVIFNEGGNQIPGAQQPGMDWTDGTSMIYKDGSWVKVESKKKLDIVSSLADGSTFDTESETITLTLKNAVSGTYCVDDGPVKDFTDSAKVVIGQGKIADSNVKVKVTATNGTETKEVTFTYHKKFDAQKNGGYTQYETSVKAAAATAKAASAAVASAASSESLGGKYATNPNSQKGKYKTISSASDFDESMIIAQGVANDDARTFRGAHEGPVYDTYALYGAWDDTNLYLGWQFVNVTDVVDPAQGYPISDNGKPWNGDIPQVLALNLGTGVTSDGSAKGTDDKTGAVNYSDYVWGLPIKYDTAVDALLCFSSKPGVGQPALFRADTDGYFNYDTAVGFKEGGISFKYEDGFFGSSLYGINANGYQGYKPADLLDASANWTDFLTTNHSKAQDTFYLMTIPLATLGVSKNDIENNGIGVMHISTFGLSGTACIPMDMTMLDHATEPYSHDDSTTAEKEDEDRITVPLARLGAGESGLTPTPTPTSTPTPTPIVGTGTMTVNFGADRSSPQATTTALTLKAIAEGGNGTYTYQFLVDGKEVQNSGKDTYTWSPRSGEHTIGVKVTDGKGIVTECSKTYVGEGEDPYQPITIKSFTANKQSPQIKGTSIRFAAAAEGGNGTLQYCFYRVLNGKKTVFRNFAESASAYCNPAAGTYTIGVEVKDADGNTANKEMTYTWSSNETPIVIKSFDASKASPQPKGTSVRFSVTAEGGSGALQYRFYRVINGKTTVFRDYASGSAAYCNPAVGTYTIYVDVKDANGNIATKSMTYTWGSASTELKIKSLTASKVSPQKKGTSVRFAVEAEGGKGDLQYRFYRVGNGKTTVFRDYSSTKTAYCNPAAGTYIIQVEVKDSEGNTATESMLYQWN